MRWQPHSSSGEATTSTVASGTLCPHCSSSLRVTAVRHIDESGFDIICESCHADIIRAERR